MKTLIILSLCFLWTNSSLKAQTGADALRYEINRVDPPLAISPAALAAAETIQDLNNNYKPSWVRAYIYTEISAYVDGDKKIIKGKNNVLTAAQLKLMSSCDVGSDITINVHYIPENTLENNEPKDHGFTFQVLPEKEASFVGGYKAMMQHLETQVIRKIPLDQFEASTLAVVKFTIDENGEVCNSSIFESSKYSDIDNLLLTSIQHMPSWDAATYSNGATTAQNFVLTVGNLESCVMNLIPVSRD